ncbi:MAG: hypothetical protein Q9M25_10180 [Mariprofundaceae bacterium]|nr:hypothetical protein [Mariprofundaceae bacterium]
MKRLTTWVALCAVMLLAGCLTQANQQGEADKIVAKMHAAIQTGDWDSALALYGDDFFAGRGKENWRETLASMPVRLGKLVEIKPSFAQKDPRFGGDFYIYGFRLFFERGVVRETLTVFTGLERKKMLVTGHLLKLKNEML